MYEAARSQVSAQSRTRSTNALGRLGVTFAVAALYFCLAGMAHAEEATLVEPAAPTDQTAVVSADTSAAETDESVPPASAAENSGAEDTASLTETTEPPVVTDSGASAEPQPVDSTTTDPAVSTTTDPAVSTTTDPAAAPADAAAPPTEPLPQDLGATEPVAQSPDSSAHDQAPGETQKTPAMTGCDALLAGAGPTFPPSGETSSGIGAVSALASSRKAGSSQDRAREGRASSDRGTMAPPSAPRPTSSSSGGAVGGSSSGGSAQQVGALFALVLCLVVAFGRRLGTAVTALQPMALAEPATRPG
jgi:hypothetical protein